MTTASVLFVVSLVLITILLVVRLARFENIAIVFCFIATVSVVYAANLSLLSLPKPIEREYFREGNGIVHYYYLVEDVAIYLLFQDNPDEPPRWYEMPWVEKQAARLEELRRSNMGIQASNLFRPFDRSLGVSYFHEPPPVKVEDKDRPIPPTIFDRGDDQ
jgi:hypothetical protein